MLTEEQEKYLQTIPEDAKVKIQPWNPDTAKIAEELTQTIKQQIPDGEILFMGASALKIAGQNDIDLYALCYSKDFDKYLPHLKRIFGEPTKRGPQSIKWAMKKGGLDVEFYLTDPSAPSMQEQIKVFELLKSDSELLEEYKQIKESADGIPLREYQRRKYEFYNKILQQD